MKLRNPWSNLYPLAHIMRIESCEIKHNEIQLLLTILTPNWSLVSSEILLAACHLVTEPASRTKVYLTSSGPSKSWNNHHIGNNCNCTIVWTLMFVYCEHILTTSIFVQYLYYLSPFHISHNEIAKQLPHVRQKQQRPFRLLLQLINPYMGTCTILRKHGNCTIGCLCSNVQQLQQR